MEKKTDLRIIRTYKSLSEAFLQLMKEKHFEDITINELCNRAMIRRTTFYKHFADKFEFFQFFVRELQAEFDTKSIETIDYNNPMNFFIHIFHHMVDFFKENEQLLHMTSNSSLRYTLFEILSEQVAADITEKIKNYIKNGITICESPEITAAFLTGALINTVKWWSCHKEEISDEKLIELVEKLLPL